MISHQRCVWQCSACSSGPFYLIFGLRDASHPPRMVCGPVTCLHTAPSVAPLGIRSRSSPIPSKPPGCGCSLWQTPLPTSTYLIPALCVPSHALRLALKGF